MLEEVVVLVQILLHVTTAQCNKLEPEINMNTSEKTKSHFYSDAYRNECVFLVLCYIHFHIM